MLTGVSAWPWARYYLHWEVQTYWTKCLWRSDLVREITWSPRYLNRPLYTEPPSFIFALPHSLSTSAVQFIVLICNFIFLKELKAAGCKNVLVWDWSTSLGSSTVFSNWLKKYNFSTFLYKKGMFNQQPIGCMRPNSGGPAGALCLHHHVGGSAWSSGLAQPHCTSIAHNTHTSVCDQHCLGWNWDIESKLCSPNSSYGK